jgi:hypothetical protein
VLFACAAALFVTLACGGSEFSAGEEPAGAGDDSGGDSGSSGEGSGATTSGATGSGGTGNGNGGTGSGGSGSGNGGNGSGGKSSSSGGSDGSGGSSFPLESCEDYVRAVCEWEGRCAGGFTGSLEACLQLYQGTCAWYDLPGANVGASDFSNCARGFDEADCESSTPSCELPAGTTANGLPCAATLQCASGYCNLTGGECGICGPDPHHDAGGECTSLANCKTGLECVDGKCAPLREEGEACDADHHCSIAVRDAGTGYLVCVEGTCEAVGFPGEACYEASGAMICGTGSACSEGVCVPYTRAAPGEPCGTFPDEVIECAGGLCTGDDASDLRCVAWAGPGESCHKIPNFQSCAAGLVCNESDLCVWPEPRLPPENCD